MSLLKTITKCRLGEKRFLLSIKVHKNMYKTEKIPENGYIYYHVLTSYVRGFFSRNCFLFNHL